MTNDLSTASTSEKTSRLESQREKLELLRAYTAQDAESAKVVREAEAVAINKRLGELHRFTVDFLDTYTDGSVSPDDLNLNDRLMEWSDQFGRGEVPAPFKGKRLEADPGKAGDLLHYLLIARLVRSRFDHGLAYALPAADCLADARDRAILKAIHKLDDPVANASESPGRVVTRMSSAVGSYDKALPELMEGLRMALGLLVDLHPEDYIFGAQTRRGLRSYGKRTYREAAVELFRKIIEGQGTKKLKKIWKFAGTSYYRTAQVEGTVFIFKRQDDRLHIFARNEAGVDEAVHVQDYKRSTLYDWRRDALKPSSKTS